MKRPYTFILVLLAMIIVYPSYSQFTGGCSDGLDSDIVRNCTPTECAPNAGTFMQASVVPDYGGVIFPCPTSLVSYANSFRFTGVASNLTGEYRVTIKLDPAEYIENLSLPAVPAYFTGTSTSASIDIPSTSPVASSSFAGYTKSISGSSVITITLLSTKTGAIPTTQFNFPVSFNISPTAPVNIGVGQSLFAGVTGRTSLPPNQVCQTRTIAIAAPLRCSFDPNEKVAYPAGCGQRNLISMQDTIHYFLHFQNTGSGPAARVRLVDTLDAKLDINTLQVFEGSHPYKYQMMPGNILVFDFNPIYLPPSSEDEAGSNGYVSFKIAPKVGVMPRNVIENKTDIYFDNNPPITTNTVVHTISDPVLPSFSIVNKDQPYCSGGEFTLTASEADTYQWNTGDSTQSITIITEGIYYVVGTFAYRCEMPTDTAVVVFPGVTIGYKNRTFCPGSEYTFTASAAPEYLWSTGETTSSITVNSPGQYIVSAIFECETVYDTAYVIKDPLQPCYSIFAANVYSYTPGMNYISFQNLPPEHTNSENALGRSDDLSLIPPGYWLEQASVSLGYNRPEISPEEAIEEGVLIIGFQSYIEGEITIWSIFDENNLATADVYVSCSFLGPWVQLPGMASNQNPYAGNYSASTFPLNEPYLYGVECEFNNSIRFVKIVSTTLGGGNAPEGFVVESVSAGSFANSQFNSLQQLSSSSYSIYPNPFESELNIDLLSDGETATLRIVDAYGQEVYKREGVQGNHLVTLNPGLKKGLYYLHIISPNSRITKTLFKK